MLLAARPTSLVSTLLAVILAVEFSHVLLLMSHKGVERSMKLYNTQEEVQKQNYQVM